MLKEHDNPPVSWPAAESLREYEGTWRVAHTKSRNEKALAHALMDKEIAYFLPMSWKVRRTRGRKLRTLLPVFTGYLFFCGNEEDRLEVFRTGRVAAVIETDQQVKLIDELAQIEQALKAGATLEPARQISAGQRCRILAGALADLQGTVVKTKGQARLILKVDMLGQAASTEIEMDNVELLEQ